MIEQNQHLDALKDIRLMMKRSSRFISLSGLSGIAAGVWALIGAYLANRWIYDYYQIYSEQGYTNQAFHDLRIKLFLLAAGVMTLALSTAFYFTWRRAGKNKMPLWDHTSKMLTVNLMIPLISGGFFILALLQYNEWKFIAPSCLIFYGLALVNGSKYTLSDIRYLGILEIILGIIGMHYRFAGSGLYFWAIGFGLLHIIYGFVMWWKNERLPNTEGS